MRGLDQREIQLIGDCLLAAADGPFFEDWEYATLFGLDRAEVTRIAGEWPRVMRTTAESLSQFRIR